MCIYTGRHIVLYWQYMPAKHSIPTFTYSVFNIKILLDALHYEYNPIHTFHTNPSYIFLVTF